MKKAIENNIKLEFEKQTLETKKDYLNKLIETLSEYAFKNICTQAIGFDELWRNELHTNYELVEKSNLPKEQKDELRYLVLPITYTKEELAEKKKSGLTDEQWAIKKNIESYDKKIAIAEHILSDLPDDLKKKVVEDCINKRHMWFESIGAYCKITDAIKEFEEEEKFQKALNKKGKKKNESR